MANGRFSNGGVDTFDETKQFIGVRLQRGVPLLDRDWNEAEDVRRYFERTLRRSYVGNGVPGATDFQVVPAPAGVDFDFVVSPGRCMVNGFDVWNPAALLYSQQAGSPKLPASATADSFQVYVSASIDRVTSAEDQELTNAQDINLETCVRDRLSWRIDVARAPAQAPAGAFVLAVIQRPANATHVDASMIQDARGQFLNLRALTDDHVDLKARVEVLEAAVLSLQTQMVNVQRQIAKLFWEVRLGSGSNYFLWGDKATITIKVVDGLGAPVVNCFLACSTSSGWLSPTTAVTDANGQATISLLFVETVSSPPVAEIGILQKALTKVQRATLPNPGSVQYSNVLFEPQELSMISKYSPPKNYLNLGADIPSLPIVKQPVPVVANVTVHAKDAEMGVVRGTGSIQVTWGEWVRDWTLTKLHEISRATEVGVRVGDAVRAGVQQAGFDAAHVQDQVGNLYDQVHDDTVSLMKARVFSTQVSDDALAQTGVLGQTIAQEASAAAGSKVNSALQSQFQNLTQDPALSQQSKDAIQASRSKLLQSSASASAGLAQRSRQLLNSSQLV